MNINEISKPCPFCGCTVSTIEQEKQPKPGCGHERYYILNCARCTGYIVGRSEEEAIQEWNKRIESKKYLKLLEFVKALNMRSSPSEIYSEFNDGWAKRVNDVGIEAEKLLKEINE